MINYKKYQNISINLEKLEDTKFEGNHPNGVNEGYKVSNGWVNVPMSEQYNCIWVNESNDRWFHTSEVQKIEEHVGYDLVHTRNSVYKLTPNFVAITGVQEKYSV